MVKYVVWIFLVLFSQGIVLGEDTKIDGNSPKTKNEITVGLSDADIIGSDNFAIQLAIDAISVQGGGTVRILPGEYTLINSIKLRSNIHLIGDRDEAVLKRCPAVSSRLLKDADIGQKEVTPKDPSPFKPGMGIVCRTNQLENAMSDMPLTITRIENGILYLNDYLNHDFTADLDSWGEGGHDGLVANVFPLIHGYGLENAVVEGLTVDSQVNEDPGWKNVRTGGVCLVRSKSCVVRDVTSVNCNGDGILLISCEHTTVENFETAYNTFHGIHAGSHSPWTTVKNCHIHHNGSDGLYICWGVRESEFVDNDIHHNGIRKQGGKRGGISIGHKDTDNLLARNHIYENALYGLSFRKKTEANGAHRNIVRENIIKNNGLPLDGEKGSGIHINGITHDLMFENNIIRETRQGENRYQLHAFYIEPNVTRVKMVDNKISGHPQEAIVDNSKSPGNVLQTASIVRQSAGSATFSESFLAEDSDNQKLQDLRREYRLDQVISKGKDEFSKMVLLNEWTYNQFEKFGRPTFQTENAVEVLEKTKEGHTFYCAHFAIVFVSSATALGWNARPVSLRRADYPDRVSNHNVAEIWSNQFNKWIMFDPTLNHYITKNGVPLNCYEIREEWLKSKLKDVSFVLGAERKKRRVQDLPIVLKYHDGYGNLQISMKEASSYACLAYVPTNRLLGDYSNKSIERWDDWQGMVVLEGNSAVDEKALLPALYYKPDAKTTKVTKNK